MGAIDTPMGLQFEVGLKSQEEIIAGHDAAGEEIPGHPITRIPGLERIGVDAMSEDVDEQLSRGFEPLGDPSHEAFVVAHVLEHLDRHHAIV